jgi:hypothetical protein
MIRETSNSKNTPAVTSDHWHVVRAALSGETSGAPRFARSIVSEHEDRAAAVVAARQIVSSIAPQMAARDPNERDQIFVRKPQFKSLKLAKYVQKRRK